MLTKGKILDYDWKRGKKIKYRIVLPLTDDADPNRYTKWGHQPDFFETDLIFIEGKPARIWLPFSIKMLAIEKEGTQLAIHDTVEKIPDRIQELIELRVIPFIRELFENDDSVKGVDRSKLIIEFQKVLNLAINLPIVRDSDLHIAPEITAQSVGYPTLRVSSYLLLQLPDGKHVLALRSNFLDFDTPEEDRKQKIYNLIKAGFPAGISLGAGSIREIESPPFVDAQIRRDLPEYGDAPVKLHYDAMQALLNALVGLEGLVNNGLWTYSTKYGRQPHLNLRDLITYEVAL